MNWNMYPFPLPLPLPGSGHSPLACNQTWFPPLCPTYPQFLHLASKEEPTPWLSNSRPCKKGEVESPVSPIVRGKRISGKGRVLHDYDSPLSLSNTLNSIFIRISPQVSCHPPSSHICFIFRWVSPGNLREPWTWYSPTWVLSRLKLPLTLSASPRYHQAPEDIMAHGINEKTSTSSEEHNSENRSQFMATGKELPYSWWSL